MKLFDMKRTIVVSVFCFFNAAFSAEDSSYIGNCIPQEKFVTQSFVIDNRTMESFGQTLKKVSKDPDVFGAIISEYSGVKDVLNAKKWTEPLNIIGHQGLSIQYIDGKRYFWGGLNERFVDDSGNYAIRYKLTENGADDVEFFKVFSDKKISQSSSPAISADEKFLVVQIVRKNEYEIRSFDLKSLSKQGDFSENYSYRFFINREKSINGPRALQALASDGRRVFVLLGSFKVNEVNLLNVYTINGDLIESINIDLGQNLAREIGSGTNYEPEGLTWLQTKNGKNLILQVAAGDGKNRSCMLFKTSVFTK